MSFFLDEPPPLDYETPPPLDDKIRDNEFDLDDEIIIEDTNQSTLELPDLPDLPTDFNVYSCVSIDDDNLHNPAPPELTSVNNLEDLTSSTASNVKETKTVHCDVAEKKESEKVDDDSTSSCAASSCANSKDESEVENKIEVIQESTNVNDEVETKKECKEEEIYNVDVGERVEPEGSCEFDDFMVGTKEEEKDKTVGEVHLKSEEQNIFTEEDVEVVEVPNDIKTDDDFDDFTEFQTQNDDENIPEPVPELNLSLQDDEEDDFNDFESAFPVDRQVDHVQQIVTKISSNDVAFEADFSGFNAFNETKDDFDDFQGFSSVQVESKSQLQDDDDDDDFGEFSDFKQATTESEILSESNSKILRKPSNILETFDMMFPKSSYDDDNDDDDNVQSTKNDQKTLKSDNFVNTFNDFDATVALGYQYNSSKASQTLVKSLGIDTRNILVSAQWNSSSSVPRFAANLSFSPIEPLKPTEGSQKSSSEPNSILQPIKADKVPEADFDWNSSGLVNPLDAHKSNYLLDLEQLRVAMANSDKINSSSSLNHAPSSNNPTSLTNQMTDIDELLRQFDSLNTCPTSNFTTYSSANSSQPKESSVLQQEPLQPSPHSIEDESTNSFVDQEVKQTLETEAKTHASYKSDISSDHSYQWSNNSNLVRTIKLPETHIFTPIKGTSPVSREVVSRDLSPPPPPSIIPQPTLPSDDQLHTKSSIFVKEYHDVEYSLEPKKKSVDFDADFDDFQSAEPNSLSSNQTQEPTLMPMNILEPIKAETTTEIKWPEPGNIATNHLVDDDFSFLNAAEISIAQAQKTETSVLPLQTPSTSFPINNHIPANLTEFSSSHTLSKAAENNPTINGVDDDEFDDFQTAPTVTEVKKPQSDPITLSPAHLVAQTAQKPSTWISSLDDVEISRIEAAFPKCKIPKAAQNVADDDDWSDFVTATPQNPSKLSNGDGDDWSEFVSMPPISKISSPATNSISSQVQAKPNFTSWNQPIQPNMRSQYVTHATSFLTNESKNPSYQYPFITDNVPRHAMNITDNFNYRYQANNQQQTKRSNGVSTILPDLDFAMPKHSNVMNLPRGGHFDPGKK